jgi:thiamine biosynthesis lipoprotein
MRIYSFLIVILAGTLVSCSGPMKYHFQEGPVYGSTYHLYYEYPEGKSLEKDILAVLKRIDASMSTYDPGSLLSRLNRNDSTARLDADLERVLKAGFDVSEKSDGAFDMTVAPLVNAWGFGFAAREKMTPQIVDSLLKFTGYKMVTIQDGLLVKDDPRIMLDVNAIAPGYASDVISKLFDSKGIRNYLVEIGGELRCLGVNEKGIPWRVGIDKPLENALEREIEQVLMMSRGSVATSGNYRKFYEEDGVKYSHTIDPKTGYPARSNLLSATVVTDECIYADAWATVFMVIGLEKAIQLSQKLGGMEVLFIYSDEEGNLKEWQSPGMEALIYKSSTAAQEQPNPQSR